MDSTTAYIVCIDAMPEQSRVADSSEVERRFVEVLEFETMIKTVCWTFYDGSSVDKLVEDNAMVDVTDVRDALRGRAGADAAKFQPGGRTQSWSNFDLWCRSDRVRVVLQTDRRKSRQRRRDRRIRGDPRPAVWLLRRTRAQSKSSAGVRCGWYGEVVAESSAVQGIAVQRGQPYHQPWTGLIRIHTF